MAKAVHATVENQDERIRVVIPTDMTNPKNTVVEGVADGKTFRIPRGTKVELTPAQYEVLYASGKIPLY